MKDEWSGSGPSVISLRRLLTAEVRSATAGLGARAFTVVVGQLPDPLSPQTLWPRERYGQELKPPDGGTGS